MLNEVYVKGSDNNGVFEMSSPLVTVALATYFPEEIFLRKQLESLNKQSYSEIELIVCDDSADETQFHHISKMVQEKITAFPFQMIKNKQNMGSNKTFEHLTRVATGEFIAFADQDDIWHPDKIAVLVSLVKGEGVTLAYSDLRLIDGDDNITSESILKSSFRLKHVHGNDTFPYLIEKNCVTGCTMLIRADVAKSVLPFPGSNHFVHDHWLAIASSSQGSIAYSENPLVDYRIHRNNQIGIKRTHNLCTVEKYVQAKIKLPLEKLEVIEAQQKLNADKISILHARKALLELRLHKYDRTKLNHSINNEPLSISVFELFLFSSPRLIQNMTLCLKNIIVKSATICVTKIKLGK